MRAAFLVALGLGLAGAGQAFAAQCSFWQGTPQASFDGPCEYGTSSSGARRIVAGGYVLEIRELNRQGVWSTVTINGAPGVRFEHNRGTFSYTTLDLNASLFVNTLE